MAEQDPERNRGGRPAIGAGGSTPVSVRLSGAAYDAAHARASVERRTVPELVRAAVARYLAAPDDERDD